MNFIINSNNSLETQYILWNWKKQNIWKPDNLDSISVNQSDFVSTTIYFYCLHIIVYILFCNTLIYKGIDKL